MAPAKKAPKKAAKPPSAKKAKEPAEKPPKAKAEPAAAPPAVRQATAAERKAALEALLEKEGVREVVEQAAPAASTPAPPPFVRESSPDQRKAAVEQLAEEEGLTSLLSKAPWKRAAAPAPKPQAPPKPAEPAPREAARATMTSAPFTPAAGRSKPRTVILDTNALLMQFQFHVDIEREVRRILDFDYDVVIPSVVVEELQRLAKEGTQKEQAEARMAIELAKTFKVEETPSEGDTAILRLAERLNAIVVTNDKTLRARLRAKDIPNIYMRSRAFLTIEGHIPGM